jgi:hypothetical protein
MQLVKEYLIKILAKNIKKTKPVGKSLSSLKNSGSRLVLSQPAALSQANSVLAEFPCRSPAHLSC